MDTPKGVLLVGVPGTGKSLSAKAIACGDTDFVTGINHGHTCIYVLGYLKSLIYPGCFGWNIEGKVVLGSRWDDPQKAMVQIVMRLTKTLKRATLPE